MRIKKNTLLGLCAYLKQLELSIDRTLETPDELAQYYNQSVITPLPLIRAYLDGLLKHELPSKDNTYFRNDNILKRFCCWYFCNDININGALIVESERIINETLKLLDNPASSRKGDFVQIRLQINDLTEHIIKYIFPLSRRRLVYAVEHCNQNDILKCFSVEKIAGTSDWG